MLSSDYEHQLAKRRKELEALSEKCLANSHASRLKGAEAPIARIDFVQRQKEERERRNEAKELLHRYRAEIEVPVVAAERRQRLEQQRRRNVALALLHQYRASKENILDRTKEIWQKEPTRRKPEEARSPDIQNPNQSTSGHAAFREVFDDVPTEIELLSTFSDESEDVESIFELDISRLTVIWLSIMTLCSNSVVGMTLSLCLLGFHLRSDSSRLGGATNLLKPHKVLEIIQEIVQIEESNNSALETSVAECTNEILDKPFKPSYPGLDKLLRRALQECTQRWLKDSTSLFREVLCSIEVKSDGFGPVYVPRALLRVDDKHNFEIQQGSSIMQAKQMLPPSKTSDSTTEESGSWDHGAALLDLESSSIRTSSCTLVAISKDTSVEHKTDSPNEDSDILPMKSLFDPHCEKDTTSDEVLEEQHWTETPTQNTLNSIGDPKDIPFTLREPDTPLTAPGSSADIISCLRTVVAIDGQEEEAEDQGVHYRPRVSVEEAKVLVFQELQRVLLSRQSPYPKPKIVISISVGPEPQREQVLGVDPPREADINREILADCEISFDPLLSTDVITKTETREERCQCQTPNDSCQDSHSLHHTDLRDDSEQIRSSDYQERREDADTSRDDTFAESVEVGFDDTLESGEEEVETEPILTGKSATNTSRLGQLSLGAVIAAGFGATVALGMRSRR